MNKIDKRKDWEDSVHALRKTLHDIPVWKERPKTSKNSGSRFANFKFGATYFERREMWYIYNVKTDNIIASIKNIGKGVALRYRPVSVYSSILSSYEYDRPTFHIASPNLIKNRRWVRSNVRDATRRAYDSFLAQGGKTEGEVSVLLVIPHSGLRDMSMHQITPAPPVAESGDWRVKVLFESKEELQNHISTIIDWIKEMYHRPNDRMRRWFRENRECQGRYIQRMYQEWSYETRNVYSYSGLDRDRQTAQQYYTMNYGPSVWAAGGETISVPFSNSLGSRGAGNSSASLTEQALIDFMEANQRAPAPGEAIPVPTNRGNETTFYQTTTETIRQRQEAFERQTSERIAEISNQVLRDMPMSMAEFEAQTATEIAQGQSGQQMIRPSPMPMDVYTDISTFEEGQDDQA